VIARPAARPVMRPPAFAIHWRVDLVAWIEATARAPGAPLAPLGGAAVEITHGPSEPGVALTAALRLRIKTGAAAGPLDAALRAFVATATRDLRDALRARVIGRISRSGRLARGIALVPDDDGLGAHVGTDAPYAWFVEFGTARQPARPFIRPVFESLEPRLRADFGVAVRDAILSLDQAE